MKRSTIIVRYGEARAKQIMRSSTIDTVAGMCGVSARSIIDWERILGVRCRRICSACGDEFAPDHLAPISSGRLPQCQGCYRQPKKNNHRERVESEFKVPRWGHQGFTPGALACRFIQGAYAEA